MKKAIIYSGGGCLFAWGAGFISEKIKMGYDWDEYYGTSAGALLAVLSSYGDTDLLKKGATTMGNKEIWSKNPFQKDGDIKKFNALRKFAMRKDALGSTKNLRKNIENLYTEEMFNAVRAQGKDVVACVSDYTDGGVRYGRNDTNDYNTFLDYVWASTCVPIVCEGVTINDHLCQDGGLLMNIPIQQAIDNGCDEIDVIILKENKDTIGSFKPKTMVNIAGRSVAMMMKAITEYAVIVPQLNAKEKNVKLRLRYLPYPLVNNMEDVLNFDKKEMTKMFEMGEVFARLDNTSEKVYLKND